MVGERGAAVYAGAPIAKGSGQSEQAELRERRVSYTSAVTETGQLASQIGSGMSSVTSVQSALDAAFCLNRVAMCYPWDARASRRLPS